MAASPKWLTESDVESRLSVPKEWWELIRQHYGEEVDHRREIDLRVVDGVGMFWEFRCAIRQKGRYKKPVLQSDGWLQFVHYKGLRAGDKVALEAIQHEFRGTSFKLRALKYDADRRCWFDA